MWKILGPILILIVGVLAWGAATKPQHAASGARESVKAFCNGEPDAASEMLEAADSLALLPGRRGEITDVDAAVWDTLSDDMKKRIALALYCGVSDREGRGRLVLQGSHDGKIRAKMVDGDYSE